MLVEFDAFAKECVHGRSRERICVGSRALSRRAVPVGIGPAKIVNEDVEDVRLFRGGGPRGRGSKQGYQHYGSEERSPHVSVREPV